MADPIVIDDLRGGRNDTDPPMRLRADQATEMLNVDWKDTAFARKRGGATSVSLSGGTAFASGLYWIFRHVPGNDETAAELWAIDGALPSTAKRLTGGTTWANIAAGATALNVTSSVADIARVEAASFNGKLFLAFNDAAGSNRLAVYDPTNPVSNIRSVGMRPPTVVPSVANTGAGAYAAVARYYRIRFLKVSGTTLQARSEQSGSTTVFTPSGAGTAARVTPTATDYDADATHWEVEVSLDDVTYFRIAGFEAGTHIPIATTFYDDSIVTTTYNTYTVSEVEGTFSLVPMPRHLITDGNRLLLGGSYTSGQPTSTVWFTPVLGSLDKGDDERLVLTTTQKNRLSLNEKDGGGLTGLGGPLNGVPYAFKYRSVWKLRPTGEVVEPYIARKIRADIGCVASHTIQIGEDQTGRPALYFLSHRGPYRITAEGVVEYLGRDNEVTWRTVNLAATAVVAHSTYYPDLHQWWLWIATGSANSPDVKMIFDVQNGFPDENGQIRGGWAKHTGASCTATASCLFSNTLGSSMSRDLKPYVTKTNTTILKCDTSDTDDATTDFQAYITSRPLLTTRDLTHKVGVAESTIIGTATAGSDVSVTINRDFGKETRTHSVSLAPAASETRVIKKVEGSEMGEADAIQITVGDSAANDEVWSVDAIVVPMLPQEVR